jgi:pilus assembly protein CpaC
MNLRRKNLTALFMTLALFGAGAAQAQGPSSGANKASAPSSAPAPAQLEELSLNVGEQKVLSAENVRSYSEGARGIVDVRLTKDGSQFVVVALAAGTSTILLLMSDGSEKHYKITVADPNQVEKPVDPAAINVRPRDNVRLDFYFVQLSKSYGLTLGLGWPTVFAPKLSATFNLQTHSIDSATAVVSDQALPRLDMAQATGWAKVMRQAAIVTANGEKASFAGGGELNFLVQSAMTTGVQKIPYGSTIEVEPAYDAKTGRIELRLHADISELQSDNGTGVPGRMTSTLDTRVNLELGQSLILGGLTARSERASKSGIPILSQIPLLGVLFGTHTNVEDQSENIVVIVPSVVDAVSMQNRDRVKDALRQYVDFSGDLEAVQFIPDANPTLRSQVPNADKAKPTVSAAETSSPERPGLSGLMRSP